MKCYVLDNADCLNVCYEAITAVIDEIGKYIKSNLCQRFGAISVRHTNTQ